jgi:hypothetical protein
MSPAMRGFLLRSSGLMDHGAMVSETAQVLATCDFDLLRQSRSRSVCRLQ